MGYFIAFALALLPSAFGGGGSFPTVTDSLSCIASTCDWLQMGADIDGEARKTNSGTAIAINAAGDILAVGAPFNTGERDDDDDWIGHVRVFEWDGEAWNQIGTDIDGESDDQSGTSVAINAAGNIVAVGSPGDESSGTVRIFEWDGSAWNQVGADIDGDAAGDESGSSVALNAAGDIVAVAAQWNHGDSGSTSDYRGHVRIFEWDGSDWNQMGADIDGETQGDQSGTSVAINAAGDIVAVGAKSYDGDNGADDANFGHVRIFEWDGSVWNLMGASIDGEAEGDESGTSVAINAAGDIVAVGAEYNHGDSGSTDDYRGHVRIFEWDGAAWNQMGADIDGEAEGDESGSSVVINALGDIVAVGAKYNDGDNGADDDSFGHVRAYTLQIQ